MRVVFILATLILSTWSLEAFPEEFRAPRPLTPEEARQKRIGEIRQLVVDKYYNHARMNGIWALALAAEDDQTLMDTVIRKELEDFGYELERGVGPIYDLSGWGYNLGATRQAHFAWRVKKT